MSISLSSDCLERTLVSLLESSSLESLAGMRVKFAVVRSESLAMHRTCSHEREYPRYEEFAEAVTFCVGFLHLIIKVLIEIGTPAF